MVAGATKAHRQRRSVQRRQHRVGGVEHQVARDPIRPIAAWVFGGLENTDCRRLAHALKCSAQPSQPGSHPLSEAGGRLGGDSVEHDAVPGEQHDHGGAVIEARHFGEAVETDALAAKVQAPGPRGVGRNVDAVPHGLHAGHQQRADHHRCTSDRSRCRSGRPGARCARTGAARSRTAHGATLNSRPGTCRVSRRVPATACARGGSRAATGRCWRSCRRRTAGRPPRRRAVRRR